MTKWNYSEYTKINKEAMKYFPFKKPRINQAETISEIIEAVNKGYKYIILEAGTGTGKSAIASTLSKFYNTAYILTHTKQLQNQYASDFNFNVVKGRSNFKCLKYAEDNIKQSCDFGRCIVEGYDCKYRFDNTCHYFNQKNRALNSDIIISNYHYLFLELNFVNDFQKRNLIVFDEAHNLENILMTQLSCEFSKKDLKKYLNYNLTEKRIEKLTNASSPKWISFIEKIKSKYEVALDKTTDFESHFFVKTQINKCTRFLNYLNYDSSSWICDYDEDFDVLQFKPLKVNNYAHDTLFQYGNICLFMSATILDYKLFAKWLGLLPDEIYSIRKKTPFNMNNNPIKTFKDYNLSYNTIKTNAPKSVNLINDILDNHKDDKGIIHTVSSRCQEFLVDNLKKSRLITHNMENKLTQFDKFKNSDKPLVFISPSIGEGVDLPDDLCRFQIMYKLPRPDWGDKQIYLKSQNDLKWYDYKTCLSLVQMHGRGIRNNNDYCRSYFIDNRLKDYIIYDSNTNNFLPQSFINAVDIFSTNNNKKDRLIKKGQIYLKNEDYQKAIGYFNELCENDLFLNDSRAYIELSKCYHRAQLYEQEVDSLVKLLNHGYNLDKKTSDYINSQLKKLDEMGYFDFNIFK